ncbi:MAG: LPXTG cell wall anchor domain-containing protein [Lactobacillus sp.]|jgi:LPXTG-motif cell wall-anchored protein|nr:LPXTG cell wall anchor domain-containing protein [Lactobacillus sp.]MCI2033482.1 LPXTG cell wall anchor domain-containing protein [Lactobacillus sp.]
MKYLSSYWLLTLPAAGIMLTTSLSAPQSVTGTTVAVSRQRLEFSVNHMDMHLPDAENMANSGIPRVAYGRAYDGTMVMPYTNANGPVPVERLQLVSANPQVTVETLGGRAVVAPDNAHSGTITMQIRVTVATTAPDPVLANIRVYVDGKPWATGTSQTQKFIRVPVVPEPGVTPEPKPDPEPGVTPEPKPDPEPGATPEPKPDPEPGITPEPKPDPEPGITPEPKPDPEPGVTPEPKPDPEPGVTPEPKPDPEPGVTPEPKPDPEPDITPEPKPDPEPGVTPEPKPDPEPGVTPEPKPDPEPGITPEPKPDPEPGVTPEPNPQPAPGQHQEAAPDPRPVLKPTLQLITSGDTVAGKGQTPKPVALSAASQASAVLPQTGSHKVRGLAVIGVVFLGLLGLVIKTHRRED